MTAPDQTTNTADAQIMRQRIVDSGVLGRSPVYLNLFDYLMACANEGHQPKEFEIAVDVLGRDSSFDVTKDSVVRVYVHQLRKRLDKYYARFEPDAKRRLTIPKGQYILTVVTDPLSAQDDNKATGLDHQPKLHSRRITLLWMAILLLLIGNLAQWWLTTKDTPPSNLQSVVSHPFWKTLQDDDTPILLVMGDYYIFGELDDSGRIQRMVRDFYINSRQDLVNLFMQDSNLQSYFRDLDMTYMPEGSAAALLHIGPIVQAMGKRVDITMMSRLSTSDIRNNHIVYIGYVSALDKLNNLYFPGSGLLPGRTFDELYNKQEHVFYTSSAGLPEQGQPFKDLALIATWRAANNNQLILISGTRDAGLKHSAAIAADTGGLNSLHAAVSTDHDFSGSGYEAVFEVFGIDRTNFDAGLIYHRALDPAAWTAD